jgi:hypothetical protein
MQIRLLKDTQCAGDLHEMTKYPRPWFKAKPTLPKDTVLTVSKRWTNFYGSYYRCEHENGTYDIPVDSAEPLLFSALDNRFFPDSVIDKIQFHDGDEPIILRVPKLNVGSRPRKNPFGSILPRLKPIHLTDEQAQELKKIMSTTHKYAICSAVTIGEAADAADAIGLFFAYNNDLIKPRMKASELQCGDIVRVNKDVCFKKGTVVRIIGIDPDNVLPEKGLKGSVTCVAVNDPDGYRGGVWLDYIEPIPLSRPMFERNGFQYDDFHKRYVYLENHAVTYKGKEESFILEVSILKENYEQEFDEWRITSPAVSARVEYLHQLLEMLRYSGCKLEFKYYE